MRPRAQRAVFEDVEPKDAVEDNGSVQFADDLEVMLSEESKAALRALEPNADQFDEDITIRKMKRCKIMRMK